MLLFYHEKHIFQEAKKVRKENTITKKSEEESDSKYKIWSYLGGHKKQQISNIILPLIYITIPTNKFIFRSPPPLLLLPLIPCNLLHRFQLLNRCALL